MALYRDQAVVLHTWKLGEADRILALLTAGHGQVRAVAKGVRKTHSKFGGRLEPTCHVDVQLHKGRSDLQIVTQAESLDTFASLRADPDRFAEASALLEVVERLLDGPEAWVALESGKSFKEAQRLAALAAEEA